MTILAIRAAMETALASMSPTIATAWENVDFAPVQGVPYQRANLLLATPDDIEMSGRLYLETGVFQISLYYPLDDGPAAADARAELIRTTFYRGASFVSGGVTVDVIRTPEIIPAVTDEDRRMVPVRVRFSAQIARS